MGFNLHKSSFKGRRSDFKYIQGQVLKCSSFSEEEKESFCCIGFLISPAGTKAKYERNVEKTCKLQSHEFRYTRKYGRMEFA